MNYKIITDSSCNVFSFEGVDYASVPLKISTQSREYVDLPDLDVTQMIEEIRCEGGKSSSSCPNTYEWLDAFGNADAVFAITITSNLSGSYSSAMQAREEYLESHPNAKVCILDSLSTGPEMMLIAQKLREYILCGMEFETIENRIRAYMRHTHLIFALKSLTNLARNGRVSPAAAAIAGALGICVVGKASDVGTLESKHKCRGEKRALKAILDDMADTGYSGGKVRIDHCLNPQAAAQLQNMILERYPEADVKIGTCGALCSFYAEKGGFMIGFEDSIRD